MGARFEAQDEGVLAASSKSTGYFFPFQFAWKGGVMALAYGHSDKVIDIETTLTYLIIDALGIIDSVGKF